MVDLNGYGKLDHKRVESALIKSGDEGPPVIAMLESPSEDAMPLGRRFRSVKRISGRGTRSRTCSRPTTSRHLS